MKRVTFLAEARREFLAEVAYYEKLQVGLGIRFRTSVEKSTSIAAAFPLAGSACAAGTRRVVIKDFPFSLVYRPEADGIVVFALAHFRRQPEYWLSRS